MTETRSLLEQLAPAQSVKDLFVTFDKNFNNHIVSIRTDKSCERRFQGRFTNTNYKCLSF